MWKNGILRNLTLAALASACLAGIQIPLIIINLSPWEATVDFYNNEYCMQYHTDPDDLNHYYASWESSNLGEDFDEDYAKYNAYLQLYKELFGVPKLNGSQTPMTDIHTIPALKPVDSEGRNTTTSPVRVFEAEIDGGLFNGCAFEQSEKSFTIHVNGGIESFTIADPPSSAWTLAKTSGDVKYITLGTGGRADPWPIAGEVILGVGAVAAAAVALFYGGKWLAAQIMSFLPWSALLWIGRTLGRQSLVNKYTGEAGSIISGSSGGSASIFGFDSLAGSVISAFATDSEDSEDPTESLIAPIRAFDFFPTIMGAVGKEAEANMTSQLIRRADPDLSNATDALLNFSSVYDTLVGDREACILGQKFWWSYDCLVVGTSIVIQTDGKALAVPLPNIYRAWD